MFYWDPPPVVYRLPYLDHPIAWYGLFFVSGFVFGYYLIKRLFIQLSFSKEQSLILADKLVWFTVLGTLVGARLGHILFYELDYFMANPHLILKTWEGGLASHGGAIGILIALALYRRNISSMAPQLTFLRILDLIVIPTAFAGACIRFGNFWNQELVGTPTTMPWGVIFLHPADGSAIVPRHPVQLYEAAAYLITFCILLGLWHFKRSTLKTGQLAGLFFILVFASRIALEYFKVPVTAAEPFYFGLMTGQWLSLPFVLAGIWLIISSKNELLCHAH